MKLWLKEIIIGSSMLSISGAASFLSCYKKPTEKTPINVNQPTEIDVSLTPQEQFLGNLTSMPGLEGSLNLNVTTDDGLDLRMSVSNIAAQIDIENLANIKASASIAMKVSNYTVNASLMYFDETIYLDYGNNHFMLETNNIFNVIDMLPTFDFPIEIPEEFANLDVDSLTNEIQYMEEIKTSSEHYFDFTLTDSISIMLKTNDEYKFLGAKINNAKIMDFTINLDSNFKESDSTDKYFVDPTTIVDGPIYQRFESTFNLIDTVSDLLASSKTGLSLSLDVDKVNNDVINDFINVDGDIQFDLSKESVDAFIKISENNRIHNVGVRLLDETLYADYNELRVSIDNSTIASLIDYVMNKVPSNDIDKISNELLDKVLSSDIMYAIRKGFSINDLVPTIVLEDNYYAVTIDPSLLGIDAGLITASISLNDDHSLNALEIKDINLLGYVANLSIVRNEYQEIELDKTTYSRIEPAIGVIHSLENLVQRKTFRIELGGTIGRVDHSRKDAIVDGGFQFDVENMFGYGEVNITDSGNYIHNVKADMRSKEEIIFSYNEKTNGKFKASSLVDIYDLCLGLYNSKDEHFMEWFGEIFERIQSTPLFLALSGNINPLLDCNILNSFSITDSEIALNLSGEVLGMEELNFDIIISFDENGLKGLAIKNLNIENIALDFFIELKEFDPSLESTRLDPNASYMDFSDLSVLLEFGLNTTRFNYYHLKGIIGVNIASLPNLIQINADLKVRNNQGNIQVALEMTNLPIFPLITSHPEDASILNVGNKNRVASLYYENKTFYLSRSEDIQADAGFLKTKKVHITQTVKVDRQDFIDNILNYFLNFMLGMNDTIMNLVDTTNTSQDKVMKYEEILAGFEYNASKNYFKFDINLGKFLVTSLLGHAYVTIGANSNNSLSFIKLETTVTVGLSIGLSLEIDLLDDSTRILSSDNELTAQNNYIAQHYNDPYNEIIYTRS